MAPIIFWINSTLSRKYKALLVQFCHCRPWTPRSSHTEILAMFKGSILSVSSLTGCCVCPKRPSLLVHLAARASVKHWSESLCSTCASNPSNQTLHLGHWMGLAQSRAGSHLRASPPPAAPPRRRADRDLASLWPSRPVLPGSAPALRPRSSPSPGCARRARRKATLRATYHSLRRSPASCRPSRLRRSPGRLLLQSSHSVLVLRVGSRDTRPGRGAGEVATGPADGTPTPGVHQFAREPTGPRPRPLPSPTPTRIALSGTGRTRTRLLLLLRLRSAWATQESTVLRPALLLQIPSCTAQPVGQQYAGTPYLPTNPDEHRASPGRRNPAPPS